MKRIDHGQDLKGIGKRIRQVRNLLEFSQGEMARFVGISNQSTYGNYEAGRSVPVDFALHFRDVCREQLGVHFTLDWLLDGEGQGPNREGDRAKRTKFPATTPVGPPPVGSSRAETRSAKSNNIDREISEQIGLSLEVLKGLMEKKYAAHPPEEDSLHSYLQELPFGVMDLMSVIRYASPGACRLFKTTEAAAVGQSTMRFGPETLDKVVPDQINTILRRGYWMGEIRANTSQFDPLELVMIQWLMRDKDGTPCLAVLFISKCDMEDVRKEVEGLHVEKVKSHVAWERDRSPDCAQSLTSRERADEDQRGSGTEREST